MSLPNERIAPNTYRDIADVGVVAVDMKMRTRTMMVMMTSSRMTLIEVSHMKLGLI